MPGTLKLQKPPKDLNTRTLSVQLVSPSKLIRISDYATNEPHFAKSGGRRFDDPNNVFGTCYLGFDLTVAFAESVLHDLEPGPSGFTVQPIDVSSRFAHSFRGRKLKLANMYGNDLFRLGGHGELSGTPDYKLPQAWAKALHDHPANIDGFIYMSRRVNDAMAVVLFERCALGPQAITSKKADVLIHHSNYLQALTDLGVTVT